MTTQRDHRLAVLVLWLSVAALTPFTGCGNGTEAPTEATSGSDTNSSVEGRLIVPPPLPKSAKQGCVRATATLGGQASVVNILVHCIGRPHSKEGNFAIWRYVATDPPAHPKIVNFTRRPRTANHGSESRRGRCNREMDAVSCTVSTVGAIDVQIQISVPPGTRCSAEVAVVTERRGSCVPKACSVGARFIGSLFTGRPRGC